MNDAVLGALKMIRSVYVASFFSQFFFIQLSSFLIFIFFFWETKYLFSAYVRLWNSR